MKKLIIFIVLAFALIVASITNPSKESFISWAKEELKQENEIILNLGIEFLGDKVINSATSTDNFVFFSIFKSNLGNDETIKVLGFFNNFSLYLKMSLIPKKPLRNKKLL